MLQRYRQKNLNDPIQPLQRKLCNDKKKSMKQKQATVSFQNFICFEIILFDKEALVQIILSADIAICCDKRLDLILINTQNYCFLFFKNRTEQNRTPSHLFPLNLCSQESDKTTDAVPLIVRFSFCCERVLDWKEGPLQSPLQTITLATVPL